LDSHAHIVHACGKQEGHARAAVVNFSEELQAGHSWHIEITNDGVAGVIFQKAKSLGAAQCGLAVEICMGQQQYQELTGGGLIVNDENASNGRMGQGGHGRRVPLFRES
jgi:hypothetical protein